MKRIDCFIPAVDYQQAEATLSHLRSLPLINRIFLLSAGQDTDLSRTGMEVIQVKNLTSSDTVAAIARAASADYSLIYTKYSPLTPGYLALERFVQLGDDTRAGMLYADHYQIIDGQRRKMPLIECQEGALRDDFNFGSVLFYNTSYLKEAAARTTDDYPHAGMYNLRLTVSRMTSLVHINEVLYTEEETDTRKSGEKLFDYVDPKNREVQIDMEKACTAHLKAIGAYLPPVFTPVDLGRKDFEYEASVMIPVFNRERTIEDAVRSVLSQETDFKFNVIVVNHHSSDKTVSIVEKFRDDPRLILITPPRKDLFVGGLWNTALHHPKCGKFLVQLDSDDVYSGSDSLQRIVKAFYQQQCGMIIGTYRMTDFALNTLPPGIIDHREWTPENGRNNALRINGLGAPRAFYTPILRELLLPNTNYGEDYGLGLRFSRKYQIGRIYEVLYNCRRWEGNSDAALEPEKVNANNLYKDRLRTWEIQARKQLK
ncbi:MAG: glycosyltransferase family A protein [Bacteroidales bacterium]|nr:glycosyltransferase family A protein [Bacteroidales bacterium]MDD4030176.1 glycosyltransferase family A protein [Bacteroidales bacterium]MDD4435233.1 glycosyltransferase family A protein [Bacteroidales bacterium]MDD5732286.1 glycosyltransferase family A protein [Bacteroidales bacterium]